MDSCNAFHAFQTTFCYSTPTDADVAKAAKTVLDQVQNPNMGSLAKLEAVMAANTAGNDTFLVGGHATAPDFHLFELFEQYR